MTVLKDYTISRNPRFSSWAIMALIYEGNLFYAILHGIFCTQEAMAPSHKVPTVSTKSFVKRHNTGSKSEISLYADGTPFQPPLSSSKLNSNSSNTPRLTNILCQIHTSAERWEVKEKRTANITSCAVNNIPPEAVSPSPLQSAPQSRAEQTS